MKLINHYLFNKKKVVILLVINFQNKKIFIIDVKANYLSKFRILVFQVQFFSFWVKLIRQNVCFKVKIRYHLVFMSTFVFLKIKIYKTFDFWFFNKNLFNKKSQNITSN